MENSCKYQYYFKGSRNYVHGTTMFESFCNVLRNNDICIFDIKDLKFFKELHCNGRIVLKIQSGEKENFHQEAIIASMSFIVHEKPMQIYLLEAADSEVTDIKEDLTGVYIKKSIKTSDYESKNTLIGIKDYESFVTAIVELNKRTHVDTLGDVQKEYGYRWAFLQKLSVDLNTEFPEEIDIDIKHVGHKKGKGGVVYTLNKITFFLNEKRCQTVISFAYFKK